MDLDLDLEYDLLKWMLCPIQNYLHKHFMEKAFGGKAKMAALLLLTAAAALYKAHKWSPSHTEPL